LIRKGISVVVADNPLSYSATNVSAGILNPITGKRLLLSYKANEFIPIAFEEYQHVFSETGVQVFFSNPVLHVFQSPSNRNDWFARSAEPAYRSYCNELLEPGEVHESIDAPFGAITLNNSGWVNAALLKKTIRDWLIARNSFVETLVTPEELNHENDCIRWRNDVFDHVIFCEGYNVIAPHFFSHIPFTPAKGEIIDFIAPELQEKYVTIGQVYVVPLAPGKFRAGATHEWNNLDPEPTSEGKTELTTALRKLVKVPFEVSGHQAGIRPAIADRRPVLGTHPEFPRIMIMNGLGTKASLLAPACARMMCDLLVYKKPPDTTMDVARFDSKYPA
jgi:glycine/D-amino acid oxidase-like deaminating enzyme